MQTRLQVGGETLSVDYYDKGSGKVLLFLHGWGAPYSVYAGLLESLSSFCRVIAPCFPGFGGTTEPKTAYDVTAYADFVRAFMKQLDIPLSSVMGHSHGGRVTLELLSDPTEGLKFDKAVLMDSAGLPAKLTAKKRIRVRVFKICKSFALLPPMKKLFPNAVDALQKKFGSADYASVSPILRESMVKVLHADMTDALPKITVPTLLLWGDRDDATPLWMGQTMEKHIPDAGLVVIDGGGHFCYTADIGKTVAVLKSFLA